MNQADIIKLKRLLEEYRQDEWVKDVALEDHRMLTTCIDELIETIETDLKENQP